MPIVITIQNRQRTKRVNMAALKRITTIFFRKELELASGEIGISLVGDDEMTRINEHFLEHEGTTDVITFNLSEPKVPHAKHETVQVHGELIICVDEAIRQAKRFKTTWEKEIIRYVVHGVLHLLGHDDKRAKPRQKMKREENRLVTRLSQRFPFPKLARVR